MSVPIRHVLRQGPVLASLGEALASAVWSTATGGDGRPEVPGPEVRTTVGPFSQDLLDDFVRWAGGDPSTWRGHVPPHFFPHWAFPVAVRCFRVLPYPFWRVLNAGSRMEVRAPLPTGQPLEVTGRLENLDENERRALPCARITTGTPDVPDALVAEFRAFVPLGSSGGGRKEPETVPADARELARWSLPSRAGRDFALLTGDFNPIHWIPPLARASGFRNVILHGFGTMARTAEGLVRSHFAGEAAKLGLMEVRFTKPLVLPAEVGLYVRGHQVFVGDAAGAPAYLVGTYGEGESRGPR